MQHILVAFLVVSALLAASNRLNAQPLDVVGIRLGSPFGDAVENAVRLAMPGARRAEDRDFHGGLTSRAQLTFRLYRTPQDTESVLLIVTDDRRRVVGIVHSVVPNPPRMIAEVIDQASSVRGSSSSTRTLDGSGLHNVLRAPRGFVINGTQANTCYQHVDTIVSMMNGTPYNFLAVPDIEEFCGVVFMVSASGASRLPPGQAEIVTQIGFDLGSIRSMMNQQDIQLPSDALPRR